jgi:hypothetical protein
VRPSGSQGHASGHPNGWDVNEATHSTSIPWDQAEEISLSGSRSGIRYSSACSSGVCPAPWVGELPMVLGRTLLVMVPTLWIESRLVASMVTLAVVLPELAWNLDFFGRLLTGRNLLGLARYMFESDTSLLLRGLSLFHVFLPVLLLWMLVQVGYDSRAFVAHTVFSEVLLILTFALTDPTGAADPYVTR